MALRCIQAKIRLKYTRELRRNMFEEYRIPLLKIVSNIVSWIENMSKLLQNYCEIKFNGLEVSFSKQKRDWNERVKSYKVTDKILMLIF